MEKKTIITDIETGKTVFSDYTADQILELVEMDKDIQNELEGSQDDDECDKEQSQHDTEIDEVFDAIDKYPEAKEFLSDESGELSPRTIDGIVELSNKVGHSIDEVVSTFDKAAGTPFIIPLAVMLEQCCENPRL